MKSEWDKSINLKYKWESEHPPGEVKISYMDKKELEEYLKKLKKRK